MVIEEIFKQLKMHNRKLTKKQFCNDYLGKSESYYYVMKHLRKEASNDALLRCYVELKGSADMLSERDVSSHSYHKNKELAKMLLDIIEKKLVDEH